MLSAWTGEELGVGEAAGVGVGVVDVGVGVGVVGVAVGVAVVEGVGVGVDVGGCAQYLPPVFEGPVPLPSPPHTIISLPVQIAV